MLSLILTTFLIPETTPIHPSEYIKIAAADIALLDPERQRDTRYIEFNNSPDELLEEHILISYGHIAGHLNRDAENYRPYRVHKRLIRINIRDYRWDRKVWESLVNVDPYFHVQRFNDKIKVIDDDEYYTPTKEYKDALCLLKKLSHTEIPIVNGPWFFNQTAIQKNRNPGYYDFLQIKELEDVWALAGYDPKIEKKFPTEIRSHISKSGVSKAIRAVALAKARNGRLYYTLDFDIAAGRANVLRNFSRDIDKFFKATEIFFVLPGDFWGTALFDNEGKRQDSAPDFVGGDKRTKSNDHRIHVNASCIRCHTQGGLQDLNDFSRSLLQSPLMGHYIKDKTYDQYKEFVRLFIKDYTDYIEEDRTRFAKAVKRVTGYEAKEYIQKYSAFWEYYEDAYVNLEWAARDLGVTQRELYSAIMKYADIKLDPKGIIRTGSIDPSIAALITPNVGSIPREQWLEVLPIAKAYILGNRKK